MTDALSAAITRLEHGLADIAGEQRNQRERTEAIERTVQESRQERREQQIEVKDALRLHQAEVKEDLTEIKDELKLTKAQVIATNGRVRALEQWKAKAEGFILATAAPRKLMFGFLAAAAAAGGSAAFAALQGWI